MPFFTSFGLVFLFFLVFLKHKHIHYRIKTYYKFLSRYVKFPLSVFSSCMLIVIVFLKCRLTINCLIAAAPPWYSGQDGNR